MTTKSASTPIGKIPSVLDLRKLFDRIDLPEAGRKFLDTQRKDIDALVEANRQAYQALTALGRKQQEILKAALKAWQAGVRDVVAEPDLGGKSSRALRHSQQALRRALEDLRELSELALASNERVLGVLNDRVQLRLADRAARAPKGHAVAEAVPEHSPKAVMPSKRRKPAPARRRASA